MNALSAPIQAMSQAEKREKAMKDMGIDEKDISDVPVISRQQAKTSIPINGQMSASPSSATQPQSNNSAKKDERKGNIQYKIC